MAQQQQIVDIQRRKIMDALQQCKENEGVVDWAQLQWIEKLNESTMKPILKPSAYGTDTVNNLADLFCEPKGLPHDGIGYWEGFNILTAILFIELGHDKTNERDGVLLQRCIDNDLRPQRMLRAIELGPPPAVWIDGEFAENWKSGAEKMLRAVQNREELSDEEIYQATDAEGKLCRMDLSLTSFIWGTPGSK